MRTRRGVSSHHNLVRFALKCLPPAIAGRVLLGELLRAPAHPRLVPAALVQVARELPETLRLRRELAPSRELLTRLLATGSDA